MQRRTDYRDKKQYRQHKHQLNKNSKKTKMGRKITVWIFQATNNKVSHEKTSTKLKNENFHRENESLPILVQNNTIKTMSKQI